MIKDIRIVIYLLLFVLFASLLSCSQPDFRALEPDVKNGVILEAKFWRGTLDPKGGFDLRIINNSTANLYNCNLIFDDKYKHTIEGLYSESKGLIKEKVLKKGDTLTLQFNHDGSNLLYYDITDKTFFPKTISLSCDSCKTVWKFNE